MELYVKILHDGAKNVAVQITGKGETDWSQVVDGDSLTHTSDHLVIDAIYFAIEDDTTVYIGWDLEDGSTPIEFLPLAGRSRIDFSEVRGLQCPVGQSNRIALKSLGKGLYTILLDLSKHLGG